jgi:hypothetical protein
MLVIIIVDGHVDIVIVSRARREDIIWATIVIVEDMVDMHA